MESPNDMPCALGDLEIEMIGEVFVTLRYLQNDVEVVGNAHFKFNFSAASTPSTSIQQRQNHRHS